jgi:hypothetical protein
MGEAGERDRVMQGVPMKLLIAHGELALVPRSLDTPGGAVVVVHRSALLDALTTLFGTLWTARCRLITLPGLPPSAPKVTVFRRSTSAW